MQVPRLRARRPAGGSQRAQARRRRRARAGDPRAAGGTPTTRHSARAWSASRAPPARCPSSPTEKIDVLRLIALGHTNNEIRQQLFLTSAPWRRIARTFSRSWADRRVRNSCYALDNDLHRALTRRASAEPNGGRRPRGGSRRHRPCHRSGGDSSVPCWGSARWSCGRFCGDDRRAHGVAAVVGLLLPAVDEDGGAPAAVGLGPGRGRAVPARIASSARSARHPRRRASRCWGAALLARVRRAPGAQPSRGLRDRERVRVGHRGPCALHLRGHRASEHPRGHKRRDSDGRARASAGPSSSGQRCSRACRSRWEP